MSDVEIHVLAKVMKGLLMQMDDAAEKFSSEVRKIDPEESQTLLEELEVWLNLGHLLLTRLGVGFDIDSLKNFSPDDVDCYSFERDRDRLLATLKALEKTARFELSFLDDRRYL